MVCSLGPFFCEEDDDDDDNLELFMDFARPSQPPNDNTPNKEEDKEPLTMEVATMNKFMTNHLTITKAIIKDYQLGVKQVFCDHSMAILHI
jgi:hypothetical protein